MSILDQPDALEQNRKPAEGTTSKLHDEIYSRSGLAEAGSQLTRSALLAGDNKGLAAEALPDSKLERARVIISEAGKAVLPAVKDELFGPGRLLPVPRAIETAGIGAAIGFVAESVLPQTGMLGKIGGAVLLGACTLPLASQGYDIYQNINHASSVSDLRKAGNQIGTVVGNLAADLPVGSAGYKAGAYLSDTMNVAGWLSNLRSPQANALTWSRLPLDSAPVPYPDDLSQIKPAGIYPLDKNGMPVKMTVDSKPVPSFKPGDMRGEIYTKYGLDFPFSDEVLQGLSKGPGGFDIWMQLSKLPLD
jgi:hypothetical protein